MSPYSDPDRARAAKAAWDRAHPERARDRHLKTRAERRPSPARLGRFVAVDSETVQEPDWAKPRVCLIQASDGERIVTLRKDTGLSSKEIFEWLLGLKEEFGPSKIVGYGFSFDANHALVSLPRSKLRRLHLTPECFWEDYRIEFVPRKWFSVSHVNRQTNRTLKGRSVRIEDVLGFFQGPFLGVLREWFPECPDLPIIERGKAMRAETFRLSDLPFLELYNGAEVRWLARLMRKFSKACEDAGVKLSHFYGAGCLASELLKQNHVKETLTIPESYSKEIKAKLKNARAPNLVRSLAAEAARPTHPDSVEDAALGAYFGGRSELPIYGVVRGPVLAYDVNSQYPSVYVDLPNFARGRWVRGLTEKEAGRWAFFYIEWDFPLGRSLYPFAWRDKDGSICFPPMGRAWTTSDELRAARAVGNFPVESIRVLDSKAFIPENPNDHPFEFLRATLARRLAFKNETPPNPAHIPLKLGANACYGKTGQGTSVRRALRPTFRHTPAAAFITGGGRAMLYRAARSLGDESERRVILLATDGLFVRAGRPLPLPLSNNLGEWTLTVHENGGVFIQAGVYVWLDRDGRPNPAESRARGYLDRDFPWDAVISRWAKGNSEPLLAKTRAKFVGLGWAVRTGRWDLWLTFVSGTKRVEICAGHGGVTKRTDLIPVKRWSVKKNPATEPMRTEPWDPCRAFFGGPADSAPYKGESAPPEGEELEEELAGLAERDAKNGWVEPKRPARSSSPSDGVLAPPSLRNASHADDYIPQPPRKLAVSLAEARSPVVSERKSLTRTESRSAN